jgi:pantoate--beta-alanine ligase
MGIRTVVLPEEVGRVCDETRRGGGRVGFVPTMGYLHEGHLSLVRLARARADLVVVSIFVNPTQFGPSEDLSRYPRDLPGDLAKCEAAGADLVFTPEARRLYPEGHQTFVEVTGVSQGLCGASRPGHFRGVATIVAKLLNIVGPCVAVFGEKDYQQLLVVRRLVSDLDLPVEVVSGPIVREPDGLAMSSRNAYLGPEERRQATCLSRALAEVESLARARGGLSAEEAVAAARAIIEAQPLARIDYIEARDARTLAPAPRLGGGTAVLALAVFLGRTRLIDNRGV